MTKDFALNHDKKFTTLLLLGEGPSTVMMSKAE